MAWPASIVDGVTLLGATSINPIITALATWGGDVSANGNKLTAVTEIHGNSNVLDLCTNGTKRWRLDAAGNVGLGTASGAVAERLHLYAAATSNFGIRIETAGNAAGDFCAIRFYQNGNQRATIYTNSSILTINATTQMSLVTNGTERIQITSGGLIGLGVSPTISGTGKLHHHGDTVRLVDATNTPANSSAPGNLGEERVDANYKYIHNGSGWRRIALGSAF